MRALAAAVPLALMIASVALAAGEDECYTGVGDFVSFDGELPGCVEGVGFIERVLNPDGVPVTGGVFNPMTGEMFTAGLGDGAFLNGARLSVTGRAELPGCRMLVARDVIEHKAWPEPWPAMQLGKRASIAYRMAMVASGQYDCMMALSTKQEWDTAAATLLVQEAGGLVTSHAGERLVYNQAQPSHRSVVCAGPALHKAIMVRTDRIKLP